MQPVIRSASLADTSAISELVCRVAAATIFANGPEDGRRYFMAMNTPAAVAGKMNDDAYRYYVAEQDGRMVGTIAIRGNAHLYHLFIDDSMHRSGLGRRLWDHARSEAARNGNRGRFTVNATPDTTGFYERLGFTVSGELPVRTGHPAIPRTLDPFG